MYIENTRQLLEKSYCEHQNKSVEFAFCWYPVVAAYHLGFPQKEWTVPELSKYLSDRLDVGTLTLDEMESALNRHISGLYLRMLQDSFYAAKFIDFRSFHGTPENISATIDNLQNHPEFIPNHMECLDTFQTTFTKFAIKHNEVFRDSLKRFLRKTKDIILSKCGSKNDAQ